MEESTAYLILWWPMAASHSGCRQYSSEMSLYLRAKILTVQLQSPETNPPPPIYIPIPVVPALDTMRLWCLAYPVYLCARGRALNFQMPFLSLRASFCFAKAAAKLLNFLLDALRTCNASTRVPATRDRGIPPPNPAIGQTRHQPVLCR